MILDEVRKEYPQYRNVDDKTLADALYTKFYAGKVTREEFDKTTGQEQANTGVFRTLIDQTGQGATLGTGDEIQDLLVSGGLAGYYNLTDQADNPAFNFSALYDDARNISERDIKAQQEERPILSFAAQTGGGLASGLYGAGTKTGASALSRIAEGSLGQRTMAGAGYGAASGATYGAGSGFGAEERLTGAGTGAVVGGLAGGVIPVAGELIRRGVQKADDVVRGRLKPKLPGENAAEREAAKYFSQRPDLEELAASSRQALNDAEASGIPITSAEALNDESLMRELGVLREDPKVMGAVQKFFNAREQKLVPGALEDLQQGIAPVTVDEANAAVVNSAQNVKQSLVEKAREQAGPLYDKAYSVKSVISKGIDRVLGTPAGKRALAHAREKMQNDMSLLGVPDKELGSLARELAGMGKMKPPGSVASGLKLRTLDYVKRAFDDMIETAKRGGNKDDVRIFTSLKSKLTSELDSISPEYQAARKIYSDSMTEMDDILKGRFGRLMNLTEMQQEKAVSELFRGTKEQTGKMSGQLGRDASLKAGSGELARVLETNKNSALTVSNKIGFGSDRVREQWKTVLGDKYPKFESVMKTLQRAEKGTRAALGSPTQSKLAASTRLDEAAQTASDLAMGNRMGAILKLRDFIVKSITRGADEKYIQDKARLLMSDRGVKLIEEVAQTMKSGGPAERKTIEKMVELEKFLSSSAPKQAAIAAETGNPGEMRLTVRPGDKDR